jgi:DNA-binding MarR family transcriptional regulator
MLLGVAMEANVDEGPVDETTHEGAEAPEQPGPRDRAPAGEALYGLVSVAIRRGPREMSLTSLSTLATLDRSGPRRVTDLAFIEGVAQPSMTTLVSVLERSGLVERRGDPADKRVALVAVTSAGAALLRSRRRAGAEAVEQLIDKLPPDEAAALAAAVPALRHLRELDNEEREPAARPAGGGSR